MHIKTQDPSPESAPSHHHDELIPAAAAARLFGVHVSTWRRYLQSGVADIPEPVVLGVRGDGTTAQKFLWWKSEVLAARERLPRASDTDSSWRRRPHDRRHERAVL